MESTERVATRKSSGLSTLSGRKQSRLVIALTSKKDMEGLRIDRAERLARAAAHKQVAR